ncbi:MAG: MaoC family dehydratase [Acidobacteria bacterium]|nr:MaoC family dehydratase [Acidobacteriota bacterium]
MARGSPYALTITQSQLNIYAELSTDYNPIHVDPAYAATTPFGDTIAHAPIPLAILFAELADVIGDPWLSGIEIEVKFVRPARCGDTVRSHVTAPTDVDPSREYEVRVDNQTGEVLIVGRATRLR